MASWKTAARAALAAWAGVAAAATAQTLPPSPVAVWTGPNFGSWFDAANWQGGVPGATTSAFIDKGLASVPGGRATAVGSLSVGFSATGQQAGLGLSSSLDAGQALVGVEKGSSGLVTIGRGGALLAAQGGLLVGLAGKGEIVVSSGGGLAHYGTMALGTQPGGDGTLRAIDANILAAGSVDVGSRGKGLLSLAGGSFLQGMNSVLELARLGGTAEFRISNSWARFGSVVAHAGGSVSVEAGGVLDAGGIRVGGSSWSVLAGSQVNGTEALTLADDSRLAFTLSGHGPGGAGQAYGYEFGLDGTLAVTLGEGFMPTLGDRWQVLRWRFASGRFDRIELPTLTAGLRWDDSQLYTSGTLQVAAVPEPASAALFAAGALALLGAVRGRRRPG